MVSLSQERVKEISMWNVDFFILFFYLFLNYGKMYNKIYHINHFKM